MCHSRKNPRLTDFDYSTPGYYFVTVCTKHRAKILGRIIAGGDRTIQGGGGTPPLRLDVGCRVFKLDTSNLKTWDATPIEDEQLDLLYQRMNAMVHRVKPERSDLDMVYEIMLKLGVPLTYSVHGIDVNDKTAYAVGDDYLLLVCLAENVQPEDVEQMTEYAPAKVIISRDSFADDTAMANAHYILRDHQIELKLV